VSTFEEQQRRQALGAERPGYAQRIPAGFVACGTCDCPTLPTDLYASEDGDICHVCNANVEAHETSARGTRDLATGVFLSPAYTALIVSVFYWLVMVLTANPGVWLAGIPAIGSGVGAHAIFTAIRDPGEARDRVRLAAAGLSSMFVHLLFAAALAGLLV
jgi:hypothetical protein